jgi:hypothetical protein
MLPLVMESVMKEEREMHLEAKNSSVVPHADTRPVDAVARMSLRSGLERAA